MICRGTMFLSNRIKKYVLGLYLLGMIMPAHAGFWDTATSAWSGITATVSAGVSRVIPDFIRAGFNRAQEAVAHQVQDHPLPSLGIASALGAFTAWFGRGSRDKQEVPENHHRANDEDKAITALINRQGLEAELKKQKERAEAAEIDRNNQKVRAEAAEEIILFNRELVKNQDAELRNAHTKELNKELNNAEQVHRVDMDASEQYIKWLQEAQARVKKESDARLKALQKQKEETDAEKQRADQKQKELSDIHEMLSWFRNGPQLEQHPLYAVTNGEAQDLAGKDVKDVIACLKEHKSNEACKLDNIEQEASQQQQVQREEKAELDKEARKAAEAVGNGHVHIESTQVFTPKQAAGQSSGTIALYCIHGTWSDKVEFGGNPDSINTQNIYFFAQQLAEGYKKQVELITVSWSGALAKTDRIEAGKLLAEDCRERFSRNGGEWSHDDELWFMAHSHGCNVASIAANRLHKDGKNVDKGIFMACPALDEDIQEVIPSQHNPDIKAHSFKDLLSFYATGDFTQVAGSLENKNNVDRKLPLVITPDHKIHNVRVQYKGDELDHVSIKWAVTQVLAKLMVDIDTHYSLCFDLDANIEGIAEDPMVAIREKNADRSSTITAVHLVEGNLVRAAQKSKEAHKRFEKKYQRPIEDQTGYYIPGTKWFLNAWRESGSAGCNEKGKEEFDAKPVTVGSSWQDLGFEGGEPSSPHSAPGSPSSPLALDYRGHNSD